MKTLLKNKILWFLIVLILFGLLAWSYRRASKAQIESLALSKVEKGQIIEAVYGIGKVTATHTYQYKTGVPTTISQVYVQEGEPVKKNQSLIQIEYSNVVRSPFNGTLTGLYYKLGETTVPNTPVLNVTDLRNLYLAVSLEQQGALKVKAGQSVRINFESLRENTYTGDVTSIYSDGRDFIVHIAVKGFPENILPGMTADIAIVINEKKEVLLVPFAALKDSSLQIKTEQGVKKIVKVKVGLVDGEKAEIIEGEINEGDFVFIPGAE